jgi:O-antigen ligase
MVVLADGWNKFEGLFKLYVYSFIAFAIFGILQLLCGLFGFSLFVSDWWLPRFPRVNGFTYEPSYFGTYLLIGWGMLFILKVYKNNIFKQKTISRFLAIMTLGMIVTSSRMTILIIALIYSGYLMLNIVKSLYKFRINTKMLQLIAISIFLITFTILMVLSQLKKIDFLFTGVGLSGKSSSSVNQRSNESMETFKIFTRSPFIGVSLGGIPSARALQNGIVISDNETAKKYEGLNIFLEMLASGGIIGFVFFLSYIFFLIGRSVHLYRKINNDNLNLSVVLLSLVFSFICELAILSMNQNISRLYLWVHIGMLTVAIRNAVDYREFAIKAKQNLI